MKVYILWKDAQLDQHALIDSVYQTSKAAFDVAWSRIMKMDAEAGNVPTNPGYRRYHAYNVNLTVISLEIKGVLTYEYLITEQEVNE